MFEILPSLLPGCIELRPRIVSDIRGRFVKTFHKQAFEEIGLNTDWTEEYYSVSIKNVLRGLHFQLPPYDHEKLVYCTSGTVFDVVLDLREDSPTFRCYAAFNLDAEKSNIIYIPKGMAHGFLTLSETAVMMYKVSTVYTPEYDTGILWNSAGIPWPVVEPILSERDKKFPLLKNFCSPFVYLENAGG